MRKAMQLYQEQACPRCRQGKVEIATGEGGQGRIYSCGKCGWETVLPYRFDQGKGEGLMEGLVCLMVVTEYEKTRKKTGRKIEGK